MNCIGIGIHGTGMTVTPSNSGGSPLDLRVITDTLCPKSAKCEDRWKTVDPIPPHLGGYSAETIAMCIALTLGLGATLLKRTGVIVVDFHVSMVEN